MINYFDFLLKNAGISFTKEHLFQFMFCLESAYALLMRILLAKTCGDYKFPGINFTAFIKTEVSNSSLKGDISLAIWPVAVHRLIENMKVNLVESVFEEDIFYWWVDDFRKLNVDLNTAEIAFVGSDIVFRDDTENFIIGHIYPGAILGAIRLRYRAGRGNDHTDLPADIVLATTQLVEFWYFQRENRDIGIQSKGVKGESYSKPVQGIPQQITDTLEKYEDISLGSHAQPQRHRPRLA